MDIFRFVRRNKLSHSARDYQALVRSLLLKHPFNRELALAKAIGALDLDTFRSQGDGQAAVLKHHGLSDGMSVYDLGCGCGRTAQALQRSGWTGSYCGADVVPVFLKELEHRCPGYRTVLNYDPTIAAEDNSLDFVYHWSVFTHLYPTESFLYTCDAFRALKPGGKMIFSFLELEDRAHDVVWDSNLRRVRKKRTARQLDTFMHRDWIRRFARDAGFAEPNFTDGFDTSDHPAFWQSLAVMQKPLIPDQVV